MSRKLNQIGLSSSAVAMQRKKIIATKVLGVMPWFNIRNREGLINKNDNKDEFVY